MQFCIIKLMEIIMDMRSKSLAEINTIIAQKVRVVGQEREEAINDLAKIAIWHSLKDGQVTPAIKLYGALNRADNKQGIVSFLSKYGNIGFGKLKGQEGKGIKHIKHNEHSIDFANQVYESLPDFWLEFAAAEPVIKDYDIHAAFARIAAEVRTRLAAGKQALTKTDDEKAMLEQLLAMYPKAA